MNLESKVEGILFYKAEPVLKTELLTLCKCTEEELVDAITALKTSLAHRGLRLIEVSESYTLATAPELSSVLEGIRKQELDKELSKASVETLAIISYYNGATRAEIDYIRGVNSSFILRNLQIRGLVERIVDKNDTRRYIYVPTTELLAHLGITSITELPDFESFHTVVTSAIEESKKQDTQ